MLTPFVNPISHRCNDFYVEFNVSHNFFSSFKTPANFSSIHVPLMALFARMLVYDNYLLFEGWCELRRWKFLLYRLTGKYQLTSRVT